MTTYFQNRLTALALLFSFVLTSATADIVFAPYFRDNAVLQRDKDVPVWGRADPGEKVTVVFQSQTLETTTDDMGRWSVKLAPMPASATPAKLLAKGKNTVVVNNILVGEVWLCSGQSNMAWPVKSSNNAGEEIAAANYPLIRHFRTERTVSSTRADDVAGGWEVCSPETVGDFSAMAFYFGRELNRKLNVPIGLLNSSWGGTRIEPWMSPEGLAADPHSDAVYERWRIEVAAYPARSEKYEKSMYRWRKARDSAKKSGEKFTLAMPKKPEVVSSRREPSALYNGMIAPFIPAAIRGVIWSQGASNSLRPLEYRTLFPSLIRQWRGDFRQGDIPFYYAKLANLARAKTFPLMREAQDCALKLPNTGRAVTIDIGDSLDIHPGNKQDVGLRLALNALANTYNFDCEYSGPVFAGIVKENKALSIKFTHAAGLKSKIPGLPGFVIAGADKQFFPATARIEGETILVSCDRVKDPVAVRYAWENDPPAPLYNSADLPAAAFRSDDWEE